MFARNQTIRVLVLLLLLLFPSPAIADDITLENAYKYDIPSIAIKAVQANIPKQTTNFSKNIKILYGKNVNVKEIILEKQSIQKSINYWSEYFVPEKVLSVLFTEKDAAWADTIITKHQSWFPGTIVNEVKKYSSLPCNFAFATTSKLEVSPAYYQCLSSKSLRHKSMAMVTHHEYFHLVQDALAKSPLPLWFHEGSAAFFGNAIANQKLMIYSAKYFDPYGQGQDSSRYKRMMSKITPQESVRIFTMLETDKTNRSAYAHYELGSLATATLVSVYGVDPVVEFLIDTGKTKDWKISFENIFGITPNIFYEKLAPVLQNTIK